MDIVPVAFGRYTQSYDGLCVAGRYLFDTTMFRLIWGPAVHAMCAIVDNCTNEALIDSALEGLQVSSACLFCSAAQGRVWGVLVVKFTPSLHGCKRLAKLAYCVWLGSWSHRVCT